MRFLFRVSAALSIVLASAAAATPFLFEGQLLDGGLPANGRYDLQIEPYRDPHVSIPVADRLTFEDVEVRVGHFTVTTDFAQNGDLAATWWLQVSVRDGDSIGPFSTISPRQKTLATPQVGTCWSTTGDTGTDPALHFLGTQDAQAFEIRTGNSRALRVEPNLRLGTQVITANLLSGSDQNEIFPGVRGATVAGGGLPLGLFDDSGASDPNLVTDHFGTVSGGAGNIAGNATGTLGDAASATVTGGQSNFALGQLSTVSGGSANQAEGIASAISGGSENAASGVGSTVSGGVRNCAGGTSSWAGGANAQVRPSVASNFLNSCSGVPVSGDSNGDEGSFVWGDANGGAFTSTGPNQFLIRAANGIGLNSNNPVPAHVTIGKNDGSSNLLALGFFNNVTRWRIGGVGSGTGAAFEVQSGGDQTLLRVEDAGVSARVGISRLPTANALEVEGNASKITAGSWLANSDLRIKTDIASITHALDRILALRPVSFRYTEAYRAAHPAIVDHRYYNVIAQEFAEVFPEAVQSSGERLPGAESDPAALILQLDLHPAFITALVAIQELAARQDLQVAELARLRAENADLRKIMVRIEQQLDTRFATVPSAPSQVP